MSSTTEKPNETCCVSESEFNMNLNKFLENRKKESKFYLSASKYRSLIDKVKSAKSKQKLSRSLRKELEKLDVVLVENVERIVENNGAERTIYLTKDELHDVVSKAHEATNHSGVSATMRNLKPYGNVSLDVVKIYHQLCPLRRKPITEKVEFTVKPIEIDSPNDSQNNPYIDVNKTVHVHILDMTNRPSAGYIYILLYMDHLTKFIHLSPLKEKSMICLEEAIQKIFLNSGGPPLTVVTSEDELLAATLNKMNVNCDIVLCDGVPDVPQVHSWLQRNGPSWAGSLRFIQYMLNITYNEEIQKTPFEAMHGRKGKLDVSALPEALIASDIRPETLDTDEKEEPDYKDIEISEMLEVVIQTDQV